MLSQRSVPLGIWTINSSGYAGASAWMQTGQTHDVPLARNVKGVCVDICRVYLPEWTGVAETIDATLTPTLGLACHR